MVKLYHWFLKSLKNFGLVTNVVTVFRPSCTKRITSCATRIASRERVVTCFWAVQQVLCCKQIGLQEWIGSAKPSFWSLKKSLKHNRTALLTTLQGARGLYFECPKNWNCPKFLFDRSCTYMYIVAVAYPKGQAVKLTFFASWRVSFFRISFMPTIKTSY